MDQIAPVMVLDPVPWHNDAVLGRVMAVLNDAPDDPALTLLVGGAVRNAVMGVPVADYDLATRLTPEQVTARASAAGLKVVPTGIAHGTVTVVADGRGFEVTTLRQDVETDGRHAVVAFTQDWQIDASRRDFTVNTLLASYAGAVFDPLGTGIADAQAGFIRFVGDPAARIAEDYLRILRFFRFQACYGRGDMDAAALAACQTYAAQLPSLSRERVTQELCRWLMANNPSETVKISIENNILRYIFDLIYDVEWFERLIALERSVSIPDLLTRLYVLVAGEVQVIFESTRLSSSNINILNDISRVKIKENSSCNMLRQQIYQHGQEAILRRLVIDCAKAGRELPAFYQELQEWAPPRFPVTAGDILALGVTPGPTLGAMLRMLETQWVQSDFSLSRETLLQIVPGLLK